jgi:protein-S-isoprenylcysteine O-methyltransferase Ste14
MWQGATMTLIRTVVFTLLVPGTVTVWAPLLLLRSTGGLRLPPPGPRWVGAVAIIVGAACYLRCAWDFTFTGQGTPAPWDAPRQFVAQGLYRLTRNPMYVGVLLVLMGEVLLFASLPLLIYALLVMGCFHLFIVLYEEPKLRRQFGPDYDAYCRRVPRWLLRRQGQEE